jgi:hypothetical protein
MSTECVKMTSPLHQRALAWGLSSGGKDSIQRAHVHAMRMLAAKQQLTTTTTGAWAFTAASCGGTYPDEKDTPGERRWWNPRTSQCVLANPTGLDFCQQNGNLDWEPDPETGMPVCKVTPSYCNAKGLNYVDGDCETTFQTYVMEQIVGTTLARGYHYIQENPEEALEGAVAGAGAAMDQAGSVLAPTTEAVDAVAQRIGLSPYTSAAKKAVLRGINEGWQRTGAVALRGVGDGIRKLNEYEAIGFGYTADAVRSVTDCVDSDCGHVGEGFATAADAVADASRAVVSGIQQVPGGAQVIQGIDTGANAIGWPVARQWIAGPGGRELKGFGKGVLEGFKMTGGWAMEGAGYATSYGQHSVSAMADLLQMSGQAVGSQLNAGQKAFFSNISAVGADVRSTGAGVGNDIKDTGTAIGRSVSSAFSF